MTTTITSTTNAAIWDMLADRWRKTIQAKALSENTERGYLYTAHRWSTWLDGEGYDIEPTEVESFHVDDFIADIIAATSPANGAFHYRNLRVYFGWLVKRKQMAVNPMDETEPPAVPEKLTEVLTDEEHQRLFAACSGRDFLSVRDTAIMLMFIDTGLMGEDRKPKRPNTPGPAGCAGAVRAPGRPGGPSGARGTRATRPLGPARLLPRSRRAQLPCPRPSSMNAGRSGVDLERRPGDRYGRPWGDGRVGPPGRGSHRRGCRGVCLL